MKLSALLPERNVGGWDRVLRSLLLPLWLLAWTAGWIGGAWAWALGVLAIMLLLTGLTGRCSIYQALGVSTCPAHSMRGNG